MEQLDGLYVLLRPEKKVRKSNDQPTVPPHLAHLTLPKNMPENCPWSLSGPQFPQPTAIQQRYCYPKGRPEYSSRKGGALWTMYGADGKEDVEFRLLHVYYSAKRAVNKGLSEEDYTPSTPVKRPKISHTTPSSCYRSPTTSPYHTRKASALYATDEGTPVQDLLCTSRPSLCNSPLSFDIFSPGRDQFHFVSPDFRHDPELFTPPRSVAPSPRMTPRASFFEEFPSSMEPFDLDSSPFPDWESNTHDNNHPDSPFVVLEPMHETRNVVSNFTQQLERFHASVLELVYSSPDPSALVGVMSAWGRHLAKDPLQPLVENWLVCSGVAQV